MKRRFLALLILIFMGFSSATPFLGQNIITERNTSNSIKLEQETVTIEENTEITVSTPSISIQEDIPEEPTTPSWKDLIHQMNKEVANIPYDFNDMQQKQQWFLAYKEVIAKYPKELHMCTIYEAYDDKTLDLLFGIVQSEVGNEYDFDEKANVVSVIFNRLSSGKYSSLVDVLTAKGQFSPYASGRYLKVKVDEKTILACEYIYLFGDTTGGCYGFQMKWVENWNGWTPMFRDDCHTFYKRKEN